MFTLNGDIFMVGIVGVATSRVLDEEILSGMIDESKSYWTESEVKAFTMKIRGKVSLYAFLITPKGRSIFDFYVDESGNKAVLVYGYIYDETGTCRENIAKCLSGLNERELLDLLKKMSGSFAILIVDYDQIYLVTDRFGTRPIHYTIVKEGDRQTLLFSSNLRPILKYLKLTGNSIKLNYEAIVSYIWFGARLGILGDDTLIEGVYLIPQLLFLSLI